MRCTIGRSTHHCLFALGVPESPGPARFGCLMHSGRNSTDSTAWFLIRTGRSYSMVTSATCLLLAGVIRGTVAREVCFDVMTSFDCSSSYDGAQHVDTTDPHALQRCSMKGFSAAMLGPPMFFGHCSSSKLSGSPSSCSRFGAYRPPSKTVHRPAAGPRLAGVALLIADWIAAPENVCAGQAGRHLEADQSIWRSTPRPARRFPRKASRCTRTVRRAVAARRGFAQTRPDKHPGPYVSPSARGLRNHAELFRKPP